MGQLQSEAIVLRSWPFQEADLLVSLFTREQGRIKGVARHAMRSRRRFGGALEPMTQVRASYTERPRQDLVRLDAFEIAWSPLKDPIDLGRATALAFIAEVLESALPEHAQDDDIFRLTVAVSQQMQVDRIWLPLTYFALWITRLMGWMPELSVCAVSGKPLHGEKLYYSPTRDGVTSAEHRASGSVSLEAESVALAARIFHQPVTAFAEEDWPRNRASDLRRFAITTLERHLEERLTSARMLAKL